MICVMHDYYIAMYELACIIRYYYSLVAFTIVIRLGERLLSNQFFLAVINTVTLTHSVCPSREQCVLTWT